MNNNQEKDVRNVLASKVDKPKENVPKGTEVTDDYLEPPVLVELPFGEGEIIKNYKEMCKLLNEKERTGNSRQAQMRRWEKFFLWEKKGHQFIITDTKDNVFLTGDNNRLLQSNKEYLDNIQKLLLNYFYAEALRGEYYSYLSTNLMIGLTNIVRPSFSRHKFQDFHQVVEYTENELKEEPDFANFYFDRVYNTLKLDFDRSLNLLENRRMITYDRVTMVKPTLKYDHSEFTEEQLKGLGFTESVDRDFYFYWLGLEDVMNSLSFEEDRDKYYQTMRSLSAPREAREFERTVILHVENMSLEILQCKDIQQVFAKHLEKEFYKMRNEILEKLLGIEYVYTAYKAHFSPLILERMKQEKHEMFILPRQQSRELQNTLNKQFNDNIEKNYQLYLNKAKEVNEFLRNRNQKIVTKAKKPMSSFMDLSGRYSRFQLKL